MAAVGRDADALGAFRQLAARNPNDREARLWIARLHERMGNPDLAEPVYRSVLLEDPSSLDAALGLASTLLVREDAEETIDLLTAIEQRAPQNPNVLELLGRAHRLAGHQALAIDYFERALAIAPTGEHRLRLEDARRAYLHRVEARGFSEQFNGRTPDSWNADVLVNYRLTDKLRITGRGQTQRKFAASDRRGGGGFEWQWKSRTILRGQVLVGPNNVVMPEGDYHGELEHTEGRAVWTLGVRYFDFTGARTTVLSPDVTCFASERVSLGLRYAMSFTETSTVSTVVMGHSLHLRGAYRLYPRVWLHTAYAAGVEDFDNLSVDRIGDFRANTVAGGARIDLPTLTSVIANYERQWRRGNIDVARVTLSLQQRF